MICTCGLYLACCIDCGLHLCGNPKCEMYESLQMFLSRVHQRCEDCGQVWMCMPEKRMLCWKCERHSLPPYHLVVAQVAVGSREVLRIRNEVPFHLILNLDYPRNGCLLSEERETVEQGGNVRMLCFGVPDESTESAKAHMAVAVSRINEWLRTYRTPFSNILFMCDSGNNRSVAACIYYLSKHFRLSTDNSFFLIRSNRSCAKPNQAFRELLGLTT